MSELIDLFTPPVPDADLDRLRRQVAASTGSTHIDISVPTATAAKIVHLLELESKQGALVLAAREEFTPNDAAVILGLSRQTVVRLIEAGELTARKVGAHWRIPAAGILARLDNEKAERRQALREALQITADPE